MNNPRHNVRKGKMAKMRAGVMAATRMEMIQQILERIEITLWDIRVEACYLKNRKVLASANAADDDLQRAIGLVKLEKDMQEEDGYTSHEQ